MRSPREISFRLRQEVSNLFMLAAPPSIGGIAAAGLPLLPDGAQTAARLRGSAFTSEVESIAAGLLERRFPILGLIVNTGPRIAWRRDLVHGRETGTPYFRRVPYLDFERAGDHKIVWELNRHQHLVVLAQAFLFTGRREFLDEVFRQLDSWLQENPFLRGINWASALEVAMRALSWAWLWHLAGHEMPVPLSRRFQTELYRHGRFLERNLSVYFSPNTHLLGEAVALHALGVLFPGFPGAARWAETGGGIVRKQLDRQVRPDGSHFEQSAYYHVYGLDFFLLHYVLAGRPGDYAARLCRMAEYLRALMGPSGVLPFVGDDDGGRLFHPYGDRTRFGRATLATCAALFGHSEWMYGREDLDCQAAWWLGERAATSCPLEPVATLSCLFRDAGMAVMAAAENHVVVKAGAFGEGSGGHSHSDVLSLVARRGTQEVLLDPGTYTYVANAAERNRFRGVASHNTVRIDGGDQATPEGPFRWIDKPDVSLREWNSAEGSDFLDACCAYRGFTHRRRVLFLKPDLVLVLDGVHGGEPGAHTLEQFWHLASLEAGERLCFSTPSGIMDGWRSQVFGCKEPAPVLRACYTGELPAAMAAVLDLGQPVAAATVELYQEPVNTVLEWRGRRYLRVQFPQTGLPKVQDFT